MDLRTLQRLPETLPHNPLTEIGDWMDRAAASGSLPNPNAMCLATVDAHGLPDARIVLCKTLRADPGFIVFYSNYDSAKGLQLECRPHACATFHWDALGLQARIRGPVRCSPADESDRYFASRDRDSQIGAWASEQSRPIESHEAMLARFEAMQARYGAGPVPRPPYWGGYRLWARSAELWVSGRARIHERARWTRTLTEQTDGSFAGSAWAGTRLQP